MLHPRRRAALLLAALLSLLTVTPALAREAGSSVAVLRLDGRGHGHGVGLSQWGAYTMARNGASATEIIGRFYPGTSIDSAAGEVVVVVDTRDRVMVRLPQGGQLRSARDGAQADGFPVQLGPGEAAEIFHDGSGYRVSRGGVRPASGDEPQRFTPAQQDCLVLCDEEEDPDEEQEPEPCVVCTTTTTAPPSPAPTQPPDDEEPAPPPEQGDRSSAGPVSPTPVWAIPNAGGTVTSVDRDRTYRGSFEVVGGPGELRLRNHLDVEDYLRGMAEVPGHWPPAAVQAQTIAARTYALRAMAGRGELCDSESCQVYVGVSHETSGQVAAVEATRGMVVRWGSALAATFYSASGGGHSANVREGFGATYDVPYLPAQPYETANPKPWKLDVALADVGARLDYPGTVTDVRITQTGPSGRPVAMELVGDAGVAPVEPQEFRRRLGLQSTFFQASTTVADQAPPPPPPPVDADQLTTAAGGRDQLAAVGGTTQALDDVVRPERDTVLAARAPSRPPADRAPSAGTVLLLLTGAAAVVTARQVHRIGHATVGDGLGGTVLGAPVRGLPRKASRSGFPARLARWPSRFR